MSLGVEQRGRPAEVRLSAKRLWKLRAAVSCVLRRGAASPQEIERLVGHCTFAALLQVWTLAALSSAYEF